MIHFLHEIIMGTKGFINRCLILRTVITVIADIFNKITLGTSAVTYIAKIAIVVSGSHGIIQVPQRASNQFVTISCPVAMEENTTGTDIVAFDIFMHEIHLSKAFYIDVIGIILTFGIVTCIRTHRVPSILEPGLYLGSNRFHIFRTLINDSIDLQ